VTPARVRWAVELLDLAPDDRVLEIGCGPGTAVELVGARLRTGRIHAVDRSATALRRTSARNRALLDDGVLTVDQCALDALVVEPGAFDVVFAVDVNRFWTGDATDELAVVHRARSHRVGASSSSTGRAPRRGRRGWWTWSPRPCAHTASAT
jgi:trans-aconitate methyltransferase